MTVDEALAYINARGWNTSRPGLRRITELLSRLGHPERSLRFVHVAGTNGKGSTSAMLADILRAAGMRTGLFISPYIESFNERIQVDGAYIDDGSLARLTERVAAEADAMADHPTHFELITAIGFLYFLEQGCELTVLETGMGGRLDSTNVIKAPEVAVITNIGLDHTEYLGHTLTEIAYEKAGIIKAGCDTVAYPNAAEVMDVLREVCLERGARLHLTEPAEPLEKSLGGQTFSYMGSVYNLSLLGSHQLRNAAVALRTIEVLRTRGYVIGDSDVRAGLGGVIWPARFEVLSTDPLFILDGGHNPQCAEALVTNIRDYCPGGKAVLLIGMLADKDYLSTVSILEPVAECFVTVTPDSPRALEADFLAREICRITGREAVSCDNVDTAILSALSEGAPTVAFGSLYLAGEIRKRYRSINAMLREG